MAIEWSEVWSFTVSPWELMFRGTAMYWLILLLLRVGGRREFSSFGTADVLLIVIIADAAQNAMSAEYKSLSEGAVLVATLFFWSVAIDRLCYFFPWLDKVLQPGRICLVKDGRIQRKGMRREYVTNEELYAEIRKNGLDNVNKIWRAYMESNGEISILTYEAAGRKKR